MKFLFIARGGLVPSRMVADYLFKKDLLSIKTEHWGLTATMDGKAVLKEKLNYDITGKKVLIVDDITDTGESMKLSYNYIKSLNPAPVNITSDPEKPGNCSNHCLARKCISSPFFILASTFSGSGISGYFLVKYDLTGFIRSVT